MQNEKFVLQLIENSIKTDLNSIIRMQTDKDTLYAINIGGLARKLASPLGSILLGVSGNLITPYVQNYIDSINSIQEEECITITHDEALHMMVSAFESASKGDQDPSEINNAFEVEYNKLKAK